MSKRIREQLIDEYVPKTLKSIHSDTLKDPRVKKAMADHPYEPDIVEQEIKLVASEKLPLEPKHFDALEALADRAIAKAKSFGGIATKEDYEAVRNAAWDDAMRQPEVQAVQEQFPNDVVKLKEAIAKYAPIPTEKQFLEAQTRPLNPNDRIAARKWLDAAQKLKAIAQRSRERINDPAVDGTVRAFQAESDDHRAFMNWSGYPLAAREGWVPGRMTMAMCSMTTG